MVGVLLEVQGVVEDGRKVCQRRRDEVVAKRDDETWKERRYGSMMGESMKWI